MRGGTRRRRDSVANGGAAEGDAKKLLRVLAGKDGAREGRPVHTGPEDAAAAGFEAGPSGERLHRALWGLIAGGELEGVVEPGPSPDDDPEPGAFYRLTRTGLEEARDG
jgi:hypothetical protein